MLFSNTMEKYSGENMEARPGNGQYFMTSLYHDHPAKGLTSLSFWLEDCLLAFGLCLT